MTLTWCSVHALKNKVLLKTPSGLLVLKNDMHIHNNIYALVFINHMSLYHQCSKDWQNNNLGFMFRFISFTCSPTTNPFRTTKQQKPLLLWQTSSCHGSRLLSSAELKKGASTARRRCFFNDKKKAQRHLTPTHALCPLDISKKVWIAGADFWARNANEISPDRIFFLIINEIPAGGEIWGLYIKINNKI